ncbi:hypothetical protein QUF72_15260 [Desulfobacterales bacterium HSG2]|nr:hypothetical protein [Desulfobacterales bacterium HSG2]
MTVVPTENRQPSTVNCQPSTVNRKPSTVNCQLSTANRQPIRRYENERRIHCNIC